MFIVGRGPENFRFCPSNLAVSFLCWKGPPLGLTSSVVSLQRLWTWVLDIHNSDSRQSLYFFLFVLDTHWAHVILAHPFTTPLLLQPVAQRYKLTHEPQNLLNHSDTSMCGNLWPIGDGGLREHYLSDEHFWDLFPVDPQGLPKRTGSSPAAIAINLLSNAS